MTFQTVLGAFWVLRSQFDSHSCIFGHFDLFGGNKTQRRCNLYHTKQFFPSFTWYENEAGKKKGDPNHLLSLFFFTNWKIAKKVQKLKTVKCWKVINFWHSKAYISLVFFYAFQKFLSANLDKRVYKELEAFRIWKNQYSVAQNGGRWQLTKNLLARGQTVLATIQNVRIYQNLCKNCTVLMVPYLAPYDHYRGRYSNFIKVV